MTADAPSIALLPGWPSPAEVVTAGQRVRWYPTRGQRALARRCFDQEKLVYNQALHQLEVAYRAGEKLTINQMSLRWTAFRRSDPDQTLVPICVGQQALRHLQSAYEHFFRRIKLGQKPGYPVPKGKYAPDQCSLTIDPRHATKAAAWERGELVLPGFGKCRLRGLRACGSQPKTVALSRDSLGHYWISFAQERQPTALPAPAAGWNSEVGIDLGIKTFATLSTGEKIESPRHLQGRLKALKRSQRCLDRCQPGSHRYRRRAHRTAQLHRQVANHRTDFLHKTALQLLRSYGAIAVESLHVAGMVKNRKLARHIADLGLGRFVSILQYKASWTGRSLEACGRWDPTSQVCSDCGHRGERLPLAVREWTCPVCSTRHDRDVNAARNVLDFARRNRVHDVEGDTPAVHSQRPVKRQLPVSQPKARTMRAGG